LVARGWGSKRSPPPKFFPKSPHSVQGDQKRAKGGKKKRGWKSTKSTGQTVKSGGEGFFLEKKCFGVKTEKRVGPKSLGGGQFFCAFFKGQKGFFFGKEGGKGGVQTVDRQTNHILWEPKKNQVNFKKNKRGPGKINQKRNATLTARNG